MKLNEILSSQKHSVGLDIRLLPGVEENEDDFALISGSREALRFLAAVIQALADSPALPATVHLGPRSAGKFHLSSETEMGIYLRCTKEPDEA